MDLITKNDEICVSFLHTVEKLENNINEIFKNYCPSLNGERYLTDREVSEKLKVSRRTLQDYRTEGRIACFMVGGKILYRESDIEKLLTENYFPQHEDF
jgi:excisionase family DNA binding protein